MLWKLIFALCLLLLCTAGLSSGRVQSPSFHQELEFAVDKQDDLQPDPIFKTYLQHVPDYAGEYNWTLNGSANTPTFLASVNSNKRKKRSANDIDADDFYDIPAPTINSGTCTSSTKELQEINTALFDTFVAMARSSQSASTAACENYKSSKEQPPTSSECEILKAYLRSITNKMVCENALLKKLDVVSNSDYLAIEAKFEEDTKNLEKIIEKLKQSHIHSEAQLKADFNQRLEILQDKIKTLREEVKALKKVVQSAMEDIVVERVRLGNYNGAVEEYHKMKVSRDESLPSVIRKLYISGNTEIQGRITSFITGLKYTEEVIVAIRALYDQMRDSGDLNSISIFGINVIVKHIIDSSQFGNLNENVRRTATDLKNKLQPIANSVLSTAANNIRGGQYSQFVSFAENPATLILFILTEESLMDAVYSGKENVNSIIGLMNAFNKVVPTIGCAITVVKKMKQQNDIYSKEGLQLIYTLSKWNSVISHENLSKEIPSSLNIFNKKCVFRNKYQNREFLAATNTIKHNGERRLVVTHPFLSVGENAKWVFHSINNGKTFLIFNVEYKEFLYAAGDYYSYDSDRRSVFTWVSGEIVSQGFWELEPTYDGYFKIKNTAHGEKLYAEDDYYRYEENWRRVFTWGKKSQDREQDKWELSC